MADDLVRMMDEAKLIAFDIFDTLIVRPFLKPEHLFHYVERKYSRPGFAEARITSERRARKEINYEATFEDIYSLINSEFKFLKDKESDTEYALCSPDPGIKEYWDYAINSGKPVVLISNMYLPSELLGRMLEKCGYSGWKKLFVSNECKINKNDGKIYSLVSKEFNIELKDMLMVGDNSHGDYKVPLGMGMAAYRWKSMIARYAEKYPIEYKNGKQNPECSMIAGTDMILNTEEKDYWHNIGRRFAGPLVAGFGVFTLNNDASFDKLFFCSRDGYMAMQAYKVLGGTNDSEYVYSSRYLTKLLSDDEDQDSSAYSEYLAHCASDAKNILLVDSTTLNFTAQRDMAERLPETKIKGCYYSVIKRKNEDYFVYADRDGQRLTWNYVHFSEYFMSSGEAPLRGFAEGVPIFAEPSDFEKERMSRAPALQEGMISYLEDFKVFYGESLPYFSSKAVDLWMDALVAREKRDRTELWNTKWPFDATNTKYVDLIFRLRDLGTQGRFLLGAVKRKIFRQG